MNRLVRRAPRSAPGHGRRIAALAALAALSACASGFESVQAENRAKLYKLEPGQTREQVLEEMGTEPQEYNKGVFLSSGVVPNPYATESHVVRGEKIEIFYYATHIRNTDGVIDDDELTPLVLVDDVLVGWGWPWFQAFVERNEVPVTGPRPPVPDPDA